jgi:S1-C subfamily serine protease
VVQCQQLSYYVGLTCIHIPDMQAYGVQSVIEGSPAHQGGLQKGDLIVSVNGQTVLDPNLVNTEVPRGRLDLVIIREGSPEPVSLIVIPRLVQVVSY